MQTLQNFDQAFKIDHAQFYQYCRVFVYSSKELIALILGNRKVHINSRNKIELLHALCTFNVYT